MAAHSKGIIALSACLAGDIPHAFLNDDAEKAKEYLLKYQKIFGKENFYIELQDHGLAEQKRVNPKLIALAKETGTPMVVTNDATISTRPTPTIRTF